MKLLRSINLILKLIENFTKLAFHKLMKSSAMKAFLLLFIFLPATILSQNLVQLETQNYKSGFSPGLRFDLDIGKDSYLTLKFGLYFTERNVINEEEFEKDKGFVFSLGYAKNNFFAENLTAHVRANLWQINSNHVFDGRICGTFSCVDHTYSNSQNETVIHPNMGLEYRIGLSKSLFLKPHFSFGYSIRAKSNQENGNSNNGSDQGVLLIGDVFSLTGGINFGYNF